MRNKRLFILLIIVCIASKLFAADVKYGTIQVFPHPVSISGISVYLDGTFKGTGTTLINNVTPGTHIVKISKYGFPDEYKTVYVGSGQYVSVTITLQTATLRVNLSDGVYGATVYVDNIIKGSAPCTINELVPGYHTVRVEKEHYQKIKDNVDLIAGYTTTLTCTMVKISGYLRVTSSPGDATVYIGSKVSSAYSELDEGSYSIKVRKFGYDDYNTSVVIERNKTHTIDAKLQPAIFRINSFNSDLQSFDADKKNPGSIYFKWNVPGPEYGKITVTDSKNAVVWSADTYFTTWYQYLEWNGMVNGAVIPDGKYTATLTAGGLKSTSTFEIKSKRTVSEINSQLGASRIAIQKEVDKINKQAKKYVDLSQFQNGKGGIFVDAAYISGPVYDGIYGGAELDWHGSTEKAFWRYVYFGIDAGASYNKVQENLNPKIDSFILYDVHGLAGVTATYKYLRGYLAAGAGAYGMSPDTFGFSFEGKAGADLKIKRFSIGACYTLKGYMGSAYADVIGLNVGFNF